MAELKKEFAEPGIAMDSIVSVTTDGAPSMAGKYVEFIQLLKKHLKRDLIEFHCILHQEALCAKSLRDLQYVIAVVAKIVNYIAVDVLHKRTFENLLSRCDNKYSGLFMYDNVRRFVCDNVLQQFVELLKGIKFF